MDCGCKIVFFATSGRIELCPLHTAAPKMLDALKGCLDELKHGASESIHDRIDAGVKAVASAERR